MKNTSKIREDMQAAATQLHGLMQGLEILIDQDNKHGLLHEAIHCICSQSVKMSAGLCIGLEVIPPESKGLHK